MNSDATSPSPPRDRRPWLTANVRTLSGVSFLQDAASELLYPVLPIFLTVTLGAPAAVVGVVEGVAEGVSSLSKLLLGRRADGRSKRPFIAAGYGLAAVGKVLIALAGTWPVVLLGRGVDRVGKGVRGAPRDALLMVDVPRDQRGRVFGFHRAADTAGAVVGPAIGLALFEMFNHRIRPLLFVAVIPAVLSVLLVAAVREAPKDPRKAPATPEIASPTTLSPELRRLIGVLTLFGLVNFPDALLLLRAHDLGLSTGGVIAAYIAYNAVYAGAAYPAGALADRLAPHRIFAIGLLLFAVGYVGLGLANAPWLVFVLLPIYGGFAACTDGVGKAWVSSLAPETHQAGAQGLFQALTGGSVLVAGLWAGLAWGGNGTVPLMVSGGVAAVLGLALLLRGARLSDVVQITLHNH